MIGWTWDDTSGCEACLEYLSTVNGIASRCERIECWAKLVILLKLLNLFNNEEIRAVSF
jgi:hypothetical protein